MGWAILFPVVISCSLIGLVILLNRLVTAVEQIAISVNRTNRMLEEWIARQ